MSPLPETNLYTLLIRLRKGGSMVSAHRCTAQELALANAEGRIFTDKDDFAYVYLPPSVPR